MHSLSLRVFTDFTGSAAVTARSFRRRSGYGGSSSVEFNCNACRVLACAPERNGNGGGTSRSSSSSPSTTPSFFLSRSQTYALLKQKMEVAAKSEDYEEAARIRDSLRQFENGEPVLRLRRLMKEGVAEERFEEAVKYRDELQEIAPHSLEMCK